MKKRGFTLAEVLITLTIIGVVATMTLPALMTNTAEQQARTGLKKGINTLTEAAQMNLATEGWDFATAITANGAGIVANADLNQMNFESLIGNRTSVDYSKGIALPPQMVTELAGDLRAVYLKDGSAIYYDPATAIAERGEQGAGNMRLLDDALPAGYVVFYDTSGMTGPNILSNCTGTAAGDNETVEQVENAASLVDPGEAPTACRNKSDRVIKDIFTVRLRGNIAQPEGAAATWVFNGDVRAAAAPAAPPAGN